MTCFEQWRSPWTSTFGARGLCFRCPLVLAERIRAPTTPAGCRKKFLVWVTKGMSGADLEGLVAAGKRFIVLHALRAGHLLLGRR
jgi:hypothetical protein